MNIQLFHEDNSAIFRAADLRAAATAEVRTSSLICRASEGDRDAAIALHKGFWPFVSEFEVAIDHHALSPSPLREKFGTVDHAFLSIAKAVRDMRQEEGSHALHWRRDAECLGVHHIEVSPGPAVQKLIESAHTHDHCRFFSVLAGTEFIAEELGAFLAPSKPFTGLFSRGRWVWGEIHSAPHDDGPSHLEIDLDLARAYQPNGSNPEVLRGMVLETISLFGLAAREVFIDLMPA